MAAEENHLNLTKLVHNLSEEEYIEFIKNVHLTNPKRTKEMTNKIITFWKSKEAKEKESKVK